jgi:hypothetical protein
VKPYIEIRKFRGDWVGTFFGAAAQKYAYKPECREILETLAENNINEFEIEPGLTVTVLPEFTNYGGPQC